MSDNPAQPLPGTRLCALADLADPGARELTFRRGESLFLGFVVRRGAQAHGFVDRCPHAGMPLALLAGRYLTSQGDLILCSNHGALFRTHDGLCIAGPCAGRSLTPWAVRVDGEEVVAA